MCVESLDGDAFRALIREVSQIAHFIGFTRRDESDGPVETQMLLEDLAPHLDSIERVGIWPGSELAFGATRPRYLYYVNDLSVSAILAASDDFLDWDGVELPDDLHFLRSDGSTVLGSIAHEEDVWLELNKFEYAEWLAMNNMTLERES